MRHLKAIKMALENKDFEKAERLTDELVKDTKALSARTEQRVPSL